MKKNIILNAVKHKYLFGGCEFISSTRRGFTLTEIIVVIVIIAALALILIPNMLKMMPDDHNIKFKKAFYTIQEIVNDIVSDCQGMYYWGGQWYDIDDWNNLHPDNQLNPDYVLTYCYDDSGNHLSLAKEICKRLNTTGDCSTIEEQDMTGILTTNGMRWNFNGGMDLGNGNFYYINGGVRGTTDHKTINVDIDGCGNNNEFNSSCILDEEGRRISNGIYNIDIYRDGKVKLNGEYSGNLLLNNPTKN